MSDNSSGLPTYAYHGRFGFNTGKDIILSKA